MNISKEEQETLLQYRISPDDYLKKRGQYCARNGKTWEQLISLSQIEIEVIQKTGSDLNSFISSKKAVLAEEIINQY